MARNIKKEVKKHKDVSYTNKDFKSLRNELRNRIKNSSLCDGKPFAEEIEHIYHKVWKQKTDV